jgi:integrase
MATSAKGPRLPDGKKKRKRSKDGLVQTPSGGWRFRVYVAGTKAGPRRQFTLPKGTTRTEARAILKAEQARAAGRAGKPILRKFTLAELAEPYQEDLKTRGAAKNTLDIVARLLRCHVLPEFGRRRIVDIKPAEVEAWLSRRVEAGANPSSANAAWGVLRALVRRAVALGWLEKNPWPIGSIRPRPTDGGRIDFLTPVEWDHLVHALDDRLRWEAYARQASNAPRAVSPVEYRARLVAALDLFRVQLATASRPGEIIALTWRDVDLEAGTIAIRMSKVRKVKLVPMSPDVRETIERQPRGTPAAHVFLRPGGRSWDRGALYLAFRVLARLSGLRARLSPHSLRHSAASWMIAAGQSLPAVRDALGHSDVTQTAKYSHLNLDGLRKAFGALENAELTGRRHLGATSATSSATYPATTKG